MTNKTHYRKVFKSDHLGVADLEDMKENGVRLDFTIAMVKQELGAKVAGKKGDHNIAYFKEKLKPWVINAGNAKIIRDFAKSSYVEDWVNIPITLYIDNNVKFGRDMVSGVRVHHKQPSAKMPFLEIGTVRWKNAVEAYRRDGHLKSVKQRLTVSAEHEQMIKEEAAKSVS